MENTHKRNIRAKV